MSGLEANLERSFRVACDKRSVRCLKFAPPGSDGWPDRILLAPGEKVAWLELKRAGEEPEPLQYKRIRELQGLGFRAGWADNLKDAVAFLDRWLG